MPELPTPTSEEINVVLVGALKPAIFHPEWFVRQELLSEAEARKAEVQLITPQALRRHQCSAAQAMLISGRKKSV
jgi:hypothetical protein